MIFYTAGVSIAGFSTNLYFMLIARGLQGVGMSMFPIAFSIVRAQFPREKIAIGQGIITSMFAGGAVIGLTIGGFIIQDYGWHATFFTIIPIAIALLFIIWRFIHVDNGGVERTRAQQQTEPTKRKNNSDSIKRKRTIAKSKSSISNTTIDVKGAIHLQLLLHHFYFCLPTCKQEVALIIILLVVIQVQNNTDCKFSCCRNHFISAFHIGRKKDQHLHWLTLT